LQEGGQTDRNDACSIRSFVSLDPLNSRLFNITASCLCGSRDAVGDLSAEKVSRYVSSIDMFTLCKYLVREAAVYRDLTKIKRSKLDELPKDFLVDMLLTTTPLKRVSRLKLKDEIRDSCNFHDHQTRDLMISCKKRQMRDGAFYVSFLRACLSEVYALEDQLEQLDGESVTTEVMQADMLALEEDAEVLRECDWDDDQETLRVSDGEDTA
jgi:hypothetical protein